MEEDIKILEEMIKEVKEEAISYNKCCYEVEVKQVQAIENLLKEYKREHAENTRLKYQDIPYLEGTIKGYKDKVEELKQEVTVLQNTKDTCPSLNTSGVRCSLKESEG